MQKIFGEDDTDMGNDDVRLSFDNGQIGIFLTQHFNLNTDFGKKIVQKAKSRIDKDVIKDENDDIKQKEEEQKDEIKWKDEIKHLLSELHFLRNALVHAFVGNNNKLEVVIDNDDKIDWRSSNTLSKCRDEDAYNKELKKLKPKKIEVISVASFSDSLLTIAQRLLGSLGRTSAIDTIRQNFDFFLGIFTSCNPNS